MFRKKDNPRKGTQAPGQLLGYSLQITESLRQLLVASPGAVVSVEAFEDIGVEMPGAHKTAIQAKSSLSGNPVADRSVDLWKTFANWVKDVQEGRLSIENTSFRIHVFSPKSGSIVEAFHDANTDRKAQEALDAAKQALWGEPPEYASRAKVPGILNSFVNVIFEADPVLVYNIIKRFDLSYGSGASRADLELAVRSKWAPEELLGDVVDKCLGWVKSKIEAALEQRRVAAIPVDDFNREIGAFIGKLRLQDLLHDFAGAPSSAEIESHRLRTYVFQLELIDADEEDILSAINSFLRSAVNRTEWAKRGLIWEGSLEEYERALCTFWNNVRKQQDLDFEAELKTARGMRLFLECNKHRRRLENREVPDDFTPGAFHALADEMLVGWHPDYKKELPLIANSK